MGRVRLGIYVDARNPPQWRVGWPEHYTRTLELVTRADELGIPTVWLTEHHGFEDGYLSQPLVLAAAIAARTRQIRIGTAVLLLALRHPRDVAEQAALIDVLASGRLELGVGAGYLRDEFAAFDADHARRFDALASGVRSLRDVWSDPAVLPPPIQNPLPIWLGHGAPRGARRAGRLRAGLLSLDLSLIAPYLEGLEEAGADPSEARMGGVLQVLVARDPERAWATVRPHLSAQWDTYRAHQARSDGRPAPLPIDPESWRVGQGGRPPRFAVLTPEQLAHRLEEYHGTPVTDVFLWARIAGMPDALVDEQLAAIAAIATRLGA